MIVGRFVYGHSSWRKGDRDRVSVDDIRGVYSLACPICGTRARLRKAVHPVHVARGKITIGRAVLCPNRDCGWFVRVVNGVAIDTRSAGSRGPDTPAVEPAPRRHCRSREAVLSQVESRGPFA